MFNKNPLQQYNAPGWDLPFPVDRTYSTPILILNNLSLRLFNDKPVLLARWRTLQLISWKKSLIQVQQAIGDFLQTMQSARP